MAEIKVSELDEKRLADAGENAALLLTEPGEGSYRMPLSDITAGGSDGKVAVNAEDTAPGYLADKLQSASDYITLSPSEGKLYVNYNHDLQSDPLLKTMGESEINGATSNYGSYWGTGDFKWGNTDCNCICYTARRISDAQGILTNAYLAITGSTQETAAFRFGVFSANADGSGITWIANSWIYIRDSGTNDFGAFSQATGTRQGTLSLGDAGCAIVNVPIRSVAAIKRNTPYYIQLVSCGVQFAGKVQSGTGVTSNYAYDYTLQNNVQNTISRFNWDMVDWLTNPRQQAQYIPFVQMGATEID